MGCEQLLPIIDQTWLPSLLWNIPSPQINCLIFSIVIFWEWQIFLDCLVIWGYGLCGVENFSYWLVGICGWMKGVVSYYVRGGYIFFGKN